MYGFVALDAVALPLHFFPTLTQFGKLLKLTGIQKDKDE
jgi:hypothetical protein